MTHENPTEPDPQPHPSPLDVWALVQRDYLAGDTASVVADRYGLSERTVRRRAGAEGWRRTDAKDASRGYANWSRRMEAEKSAAGEFPDLMEVLDARRREQFDLLAAPDAATLRLFAFRKAAEFAAMDHPSRATLWMRLVQQLDRVGDRLDRDDAELPQADYMRAAFLNRMDMEADEAAAKAAPSEDP